MAMHGKRVLVRMVSTAGTGDFYMTEKNPSNTPDKLEMMKYDRKLRKHVMFKEASSVKGKKKD